MKKFLTFIFLFLLSINLYGNNYFSSLIDAAYKNNYIVKSYEKYIKSVEKNIDIAKGNFFPKIDFSYTFTGTTEPGQAAFIKAKQGKFTMNYYYNHMINPPFVKNHQFMVSLIQPIFSKGNIYLSKKQAKLNYEAALHSFNQVKKDIKFQIFIVLINGNKLFENIKIAENMRNKAETYFETIKNFYKNGTALKSDYYYAKFNLEQANIKLQALKNNLKKLEYALKQLTGKDFKLKKVNFKIPANFNLKNLIEYGLNNRDDILCFKKYVKIAEIEVRKKKNDNLPEVFGFANYERNSERLTDFNKDGYTVGVGIKFNIFNGMINKNQIEKAEFNLMRMKNLLKNTEESLKREIKDAFVDYQNSEFVYETMKKLVKTNKTALDISERRFQQGLERITTLIDMQTNYKNSLYKLSEAKWDMVLKYYTILYRAGKF